MLTISYLYKSINEKFSDLEESLSVGQGFSLA